MSLSFVEDAAYRRLLDFYYMQGGALPDEKTSLYRITNATTAGERRAVDLVVKSYFAVNGDGNLHNKRADEEIAFTTARAKLQSSRANKRWADDSMPEVMPEVMPERKRKGMPQKCPPSPSPSFSSSLRSEEKARGARLSPDWKLPAEWRAWAIAVRPDLDVDLSAENFADFWHAKSGQDAEKLDWLATWRRWMCRIMRGCR